MMLGRFDLPGYYVGDCRALLAELPDDSVNCVVTSPPYWGLRDYGVAGQLGLEETPDAYVAAMVEVFEGVWRVLRPDGTLWLNLGDSYATGAGAVGDHPGGGMQGDRWAGRTPVRGERTRQLRDGRHAGKHTAMAALGPMTQPNRLPIPGLKPKDLVGIPWRMAFALQAAGWWLRSDIIWAKPNPMPESVTDRPTKAHEYLFLLAKSESYHYDAEAIRERATYRENRATFRGSGVYTQGQSYDNHSAAQDKDAGAVRLATENRNRRSVWTIATEPTPDAHFATFPRRLVEPCILAGCPPGGVVLDPFGGSGTVGRVAEDLGRKWLLFDLSPSYARIAERKTAQRSLLGRIPEARKQSATSPGVAPGALPERI